MGSASPDRLSVLVTALVPLKAAPDEWRYTSHIAATFDNIYIA